MNTDHQKLLVT